MGQVSVLVSVFGGEKPLNQNLDHDLWLMMIMITIITDWPFTLFELLSLPGTVLPPGYSLWLFSYKPFMWCRIDARLWHAYYLNYL